MSKKVIITGMGAVAPIGQGTQECFQAAIDGVCGISKPKRFDAELTQIHASGEVLDFDPLRFLTKRESRRMARFTQMALCTAMEAWDHSGMQEGDFDPCRVGVILGCGIGGLEEICEQYDLMLNEGARAVSSLFIPRTIINTASGLISIKLGLHGPSFGVVTACASGTDAIGQAYYAIKEGRLDAVVVGGAESVMSSVAVQGFHQMQALSESEDPMKASRPFDQDRDGFVMGEGAAFMILESEEHAKKRGAKGRGEIAGYGQTCDAHHITAPSPDGKYTARAMEIAVEEGGISLEDVGYINAHGTSTPLNDVGESKAIELCFGDHAKKLLVNSTKSMTGHMLGAAGAFEAVMTTMALNKGISPPTIGLENEGEGCNLDYVKGKARKMDTQYGLSNSLGFGGHNSSVLIKKQS